MNKTYNCTFTAYKGISKKYSCMNGGTITKSGILESSNVNCFLKLGSDFLCGGSKFFGGRF